MLSKTKLQRRHGSEIVFITRPKHNTINYLCINTHLNLHKGMTDVERLLTHDSLPATDCRLHYIDCEITNSTLSFHKLKALVKSLVETERGVGQLDRSVLVRRCTFFS